MKFALTFTMDDEDGEPEHELGLTEEQYEKLLRDIPGYDIEIERIE